VERLPDSPRFKVPHIGWNHVYPPQHCPTVGASAPPLFSSSSESPHGPYYFVHSYRLPLRVTGRSQCCVQDFAAAVCYYGDGRTAEATDSSGAATRSSETAFVAAVRRGSTLATQFHPEKSGQLGLRLIRRFLSGELDVPAGEWEGKGKGKEQMPARREGGTESVPPVPARTLTKRVVACLDVRSNEKGDIVVTKGDQYDCRESSDGKDAEVRSLGRYQELTHQPPSTMFNIPLTCTH